MARYVSPTNSMDGQLRVAMKVEFRLAPEDLATALWLGLTYGIKRGVSCDWPDIKAEDVDRGVKNGLMYNGVKCPVPDDDNWRHGGEQWALRQVKRVYGFKG